MAHQADQKRVEEAKKRQLLAAAKGVSEKILHNIQTIGTNYFFDNSPFLFSHPLPFLVQP